jgi:hypothetical protein
MIYSVTVVLPHHVFLGYMEVIDTPNIEEILELTTPRLLFKVIKLSESSATMTLRFNVIYHDVDVFNVLRGIGFEDHWDIVCKIRLQAP